MDTVRDAERYRTALDQCLAFKGNIDGNTLTDLAAVPRQTIGDVHCKVLHQNRLGGAWLTEPT